MKAKNLIITCDLPPGDVCALTGAIDALHKSHPGKFKTELVCLHPEIAFNNPQLEEVDAEDAVIIESSYTVGINNAKDSLDHFINGYIKDLESQLGINIKTCVNKPKIELSNEERRWKPPIKEYWLVNAGIKNDFTTKLAAQPVIESPLNATSFRVTFLFLIA